jgi:hypothetical protein
MVGVSVEENVVENIDAQFLHDPISAVPTLEEERAIHDVGDLRAHGEVIPRFNRL